MTIFDCLLDEIKSLPRPNPQQTWSELVGQVQMDELLCGAFYLWKVPSKMGDVFEVYRLDPIKVVFDKTRNSYLVREGANELASISVSDVVDGARKKAKERRMAKVGFTSNHFTDNGVPCGGCTYGVGFNISWQNGPLGRNEGRCAPNGAFVEDIIAAAKDRIEHYQSSKFNCQENADAIYHLELALKSLNSRTKRREMQDVEGTHEGS